MIDYEFLSIEILETLNKVGFSCICNADSQKIDLIVGEN